MINSSKKAIAFGILFAGILASVAAVLQSGWTSTTNPATARTALAVPGLAVNNSFSGGNTFTSGVTNNSAAGFKGNGAGLTNITSTGLTDSTNLARLNAANSFSLINPLTTIAEAWIGPSSTAGVYFKGGNVGIGTTTPTSGRLVVDGGGITFGTDNTYGIGAVGANRPSMIQVGTADSSFAGNLGVGTVSPSGKFHVEANALNVLFKSLAPTVGYSRFFVYNDLDVGLSFIIYGSEFPGNTLGYTNSGLSSIMSSATNAFVISTSFPNPLVFGTDNTERMTINSVGNVGIGTNNPNAKLHVRGDSLIRTNIAQFDVTITDFVIGTRYTNSNRRSFVAASFQLAAAVAGTAAVTFSVEQAGTTNNLTVSSGPLAGLTTIEPLALLVGPGAFYYFTDVSSGAGAVASIVAGTSSQTGF